MLQIQSFKPDFLTAFGMIALSAVCVSWVMWLLGRQYWRQGIAYAVLSSLLCGVAYAIFAVQAKLGMLELQVTAKILISVAIATFTIALQRFRQSKEWWRDGLSLLLPVVASLLLAAWYLPNDLIGFNRMQTVVTVLQTLCTLQVLISMRTYTPGNGWVLVMVAIVGQLISIVPLVFVKDRPSPILGGQMQMADLLSMWGLCVVLFLKLLISSVGLLIMLRDRQAALERHQAGLDPLTQLPNRDAMVRNMTQLMQAATEQEKVLSVLLMDIDHFKRVNDQYGHLAGDLVIQMVARILKLQLREGDVVARYGGEEFVLVLPQTRPREALAVAQRTRDAIRNTMVPLDNGTVLQVTVSVGVHASLPMPDADWKSLIALADDAMYRAKRRGRDRVELSPATVQEDHALASV